MGIQLKKAVGPQGDINVTPLIDIVLVMLIIFMVMTPMKINEMLVNLPEETTMVANEDEAKDQLIVAVYADGSTALNKTMMAPEELARQLKVRLKYIKPRLVFVDAHPDTSYGQFVGVLDIVQASGADRIGLARMKEEGPAVPEAPGAAPVQ